MRKTIQSMSQYILWTVISFLLFTATVAHAANGCDNGKGLKNPLRNICSFEEFVELLLKAVINIGTPIAVLFIVYSGFLFVTAQGNETKLQKAKDTFFYTVIGVTIFLGSWALAIIVKNTIVLLTK